MKKSQEKRKKVYRLMDNHQLVYNNSNGEYVAGQNFKYNFQVIVFNNKRKWAMSTCPTIKSISENLVAKLYPMF
jgi:hypothetical protein